MCCGCIQYPKIQRSNNLIKTFLDAKFPLTDHRKQFWNNSGKSNVKYLHILELHLDVKGPITRLICLPFFTPSESKRQKQERKIYLQLTRLRILESFIGILQWFSLKQNLLPAIWKQLFKLSIHKHMPCKYKKIRFIGNQKDRNTDNLLKIKISVVFVTPMWGELSIVWV